MKSKFRFLLKFNPAVHKIWLHLLAGAIWLAVGGMLASISSRWLQPLALPSELEVLLAGLVSAALIYYFGFSKLARKNILRINAYRKKRICLFAFQEWKSYPMVVFMVSLGIYLRTYSSIPKPILAVLYLGIGGGLFLASLHYFAHAFHILKPQPAGISR